MDLRFRGSKEEAKKKSPIEVVKQLDAFPKVQDDYVQNTTIGGSLSIISNLLIIFLIYNEVKFYTEKKLIFKFAPDTDMDRKLKINIDLTVAMPCRSIGADILDSTNQNVFSFGVLEEEDTWWELCPNQRLYFDYIQHLNSYLREEYHSIADILYRGDPKYTVYSLPERTVKPKRPYDACRVHGSLTLNKVAGNFHITAGRSLHFPEGHVHLNIIFDNPILANFSHRINRFSFGTHTSGIVHPLEGEEKLLDDHRSMVQYYIEVVPTDVESGLMSTVQTFQYSVKENIRIIDHDTGSHGVSGIYFKYDVSALKVIVRLDRDSLLQFLIRLCSIIAGIVVIAGLLNSLILFCLDRSVRALLPEVAQQIKEFQRTQRISQSTYTPPPPKQNLLIAGSNVPFLSQ